MDKLLIQIFRKTEIFPPIVFAQVQGKILRATENTQHSRTTTIMLHSGAWIHRGHIAWFQRLPQATKPSSTIAHFLEVKGVSRIVVVGQGHGLWVHELCKISTNVYKGKTVADSHYSSLCVTVAGMQQSEYSYCEQRISFLAPFMCAWVPEVSTLTYLFIRDSNWQCPSKELQWTWLLVAYKPSYFLISILDGNTDVHSLKQETQMSFEHIR